MYNDQIGLAPFPGEMTRVGMYTPEQATNATPAQLQADPVFRHWPGSIFDLADVSNSEIDSLLARGIPALSCPAGGPGGAALFSADERENLNEHARSARWPRNGNQNWPGWRHSDMKSVALPFVKSAFGSILQ